MDHGQENSAFASSPLLGGEDCARIFRLQAPSARAFPVVCSSPHSGRCYPRSFVSAAALPLDVLRRSEDFLVDRLFSAAPQAGCWLLAAQRPRAWVDLNRAPDELDPEIFEGPAPPGLPLHEKSPRVAAGLGVIPRIVSEGLEIHSRKLPWAEAEARLSSGHAPYHRALEHLLHTLRRNFGQAILLDCHSMPSSAARAMTPLAGRRPHIILGDRDGESCAPLLTDVLEDLFRRAGLRVSRNRVYSGGHITRHYGACGLGFQAIQIEINRELYMDEDALAPSASFSALQRKIAGVLRALPARLAPLAGGFPAAAE